MINDFAVLVLSCDNYSDMWRPFIVQFRKYFPDTNVPIYLGSNLIAVDEPGVIPILSGDDMDWSRSYKKILAQIEEEKLAVMLDDYLLASHVDMDRLARVLDFIYSTEAKFVNYDSSIPTDEATDRIDIGRYSFGAPYRATVVGFWDREFLMDLLLPGESAWDFEIMGSYRASCADGFFGLTSPLFKCINVIEKGRWVPRSLKWAEKEGVVLNLDRRPMLRGTGQVKSNLQHIYCMAMRRIPWQRRVRWMNTLRRALMSY